MSHCDGPASGLVKSPLGLLVFWPPSSGFPLCLNPSSSTSRDRLHPAELMLLLFSCNSNKRAASFTFKLLQLFNIQEHTHLGEARLLCEGIAVALEEPVWLVERRCAAGILSELFP